MDKKFSDWPRKNGHKKWMMTTVLNKKVQEVDMQSNSVLNHIDLLCHWYLYSFHKESHLHVPSLVENNIMVLQWRRYNKITFFSLIRLLWMEWSPFIRTYFNSLQPTMCHFVRNLIDSGPVKLEKLMWKGANGWMIN